MNEKTNEKIEAIGVLGSHNNDLASEREEFMSNTVGTAIVVAVRELPPSVVTTDTGASVVVVEDDENVILAAGVVVATAGMTILVNGFIVVEGLITELWLVV
jgi:hypothetical protein